MWAVLSGPPLFWPSKIYIYHLFTQQYYLDKIFQMVQFLSKKVDLNDLLLRLALLSFLFALLSFPVCFEQSPFFNWISLLFSMDPSTKERADLYQSAPGFEPSTFLIHDLEIETWRSRPLGLHRPTLAKPIFENYNCRELNLQELQNCYSDITTTLLQQCNDKYQPSVLLFKLQGRFCEFNRLTSLTLVGPTRQDTVIDPFVVLHLNNRL